MDFTRTPGFISLHRQIMQWEWYDDLPTFKLFIHLLLKANHSDKYWKGILVKRGQVATGRHILASESGLTEQQVRTALNKLKQCGSATSKITRKYSIITITNYDSYQLSNQINNQIITTNQPDNNQMITTTNNNNNNNNKDNDNKRERAREDKSLLEAMEFLREESPRYDGTEERLYVSMPDDYFHCVDGDSERIWNEWEKFVRYFCGADAKRKRKKDWKRAWQNWYNK